MHWKNLPPISHFITYFIKKEAYSKVEILINLTILLLHQGHLASVCLPWKFVRVENTIMTQFSATSLIHDDVPAVSLP